MHRFQKILAVALLSLLGGCQSVQVSQDYDASKSFSALRTYDWQTKTQPKSGDIRVDNPLLDARIRTAVDRVLSERGYRIQSQPTPDFTVAYQYQIRRKIESDDVGVGVGFGWGGRSRYGGIGMDTGRYLSEYDEGMLVIDLYDTARGGLLWRGTGTTRVDQHARPEDITKGVNEAVEKILSQFPPLPN